MTCSSMKGGVRRREGEGEGERCLEEAFEKVGSKNGHIPCTSSYVPLIQNSSGRLKLHKPPRME